MEEKIISFDTAKLAKEKGFPQKIFNTSWYNRLGNLNGIVNIEENGTEVYSGFDSYQSDTSRKVTRDYYEECCSYKYLAPTQSLLQRWLRDVHHLQLFVGKELSSTWVWTIWGKSASTYLDVYYTYEDTLEAGLNQALKLIKL